MSTFREYLMSEAKIGDIIKDVINGFSGSDDPYDVAVEIGKDNNWSQKQIEAAERIIRKKYIK